MGAGSYPAGIGPAGADPPEGPSNRPDRTPLTATHFDGATRDWVILEDGRWQATHWADQGVQLSLLVARGRIAARPQVGHTLREIRNLGAPSLEADVRDRVLDAFPLSRLLAEGSVEIDKIEHAVRPHGGLLVAVTYYNLETDPLKRKRLTRTTQV